MTDTLIAGKPNFNYTELCKLLSQAVSVMNDSMHLILKPKKLGWHDNVDVHPEMKLFNLKNVPMLYETVYSVMSRNYDGNYKNDPKVHQLELTVLFFIFLCKGEDAKKLATWPECLHGLAQVQASQPSPPVLEHGAVLHIYE